jgi:hypothetical protein
MANRCHITRYGLPKIERVVFGMHAHRRALQRPVPAGKCSRSVGLKGFESKS